MKGLKIIIKGINGITNVQREQINFMNKGEDISDFDKILQEIKGKKLLDSLLEDELYIKGNTKVLTLEDLERAYRITLTKIGNYLEKIYNKFDLNDNLTAEFKIDRMGKVVVDDSHPNKSELEEVINDDFEIQNSFKKLSALKSLIEQAKKHIEFKDLYNKNPELAVAKYSYLFDDNSHGSFRLSYKDGQMDVEYV